MRDVFKVGEKILWETFFPCPFFGKSKTLYPVVVTLSTMLVKKTGMGLLNHVKSVNIKYLRLKLASTDLI